MQRHQMHIGHEPGILNEIFGQCEVHANIGGLHVKVRQNVNDISEARHFARVIAESARYVEVKQYVTFTCVLDDACRGAWVTIFSLGDISQGLGE